MQPRPLVIPIIGIYLICTIRRRVGIPYYRSVSNDTPLMRVRFPNEFRKSSVCLIPIYGLPVWPPFNKTCLFDTHPFWLSEVVSRMPFRGAHLASGPATINKDYARIRIETAPATKTKTKPYPGLARVRPSKYYVRRIPNPNVTRPCLYPTIQAGWDI